MWRLSGKIYIVNNRKFYKVFAYTMPVFVECFPLKLESVDRPVMRY
jgi:hypothetical protein